MVCASEPLGKPNIVIYHQLIRGPKLLCKSNWNFDTNKKIIAINKIDVKISKNSLWKRINKILLNCINFYLYIHLKWISISTSSAVHTSYLNLMLWNGTMIVLLHLNFWDWVHKMQCFLSISPSVSSFVEFCQEFERILEKAIKAGW